MADPIGSNEEGYNIWSQKYDQYPNVTVAADEMAFPNYWKNLSGKNILEIGPGTGRHTQKLIAQNNTVTGIDISQGMLNVAQDKIKSDQLKLILGDFATYDGFAANQFDDVICALVAEHFENLNAFFKKVFDILKPEGKVFISEIHPTRSKLGVLAHFQTESGSEIHLISKSHSEEDMSMAAFSAGMELIESGDVFGSQELAELNPKWEKHIGEPLVKIYIFQKPG